VWRYRWLDQCYSGVLATAGGLLFVGRNDGRLTAIASATGRQVWEFQTGAGMNAPVSTFEYKGKQYVLAYSAGNALIGSARGDSVWLFGVDGTLGPVEPGTPAQRTTNLPEGAITGAAAARLAADAPPDVANGQRLFEQTCVICHGEDGRGGHGGGAALDKVTEVAAVMQVVGAGRNNMPPFAGAFTPEQIRDVAGYVVTALGAKAPR
jgi:mono/diheme cytochrome c family protein